MPVRWDQVKDSFMLNCLLTDPNVVISSATIKGMVANWREYKYPPLSHLFSLHVLHLIPWAAQCATLTEFHIFVS